ncbi:MAG TPA: hypothetical protein DCM08_01860 [Microscillaceae bacterium]|nr:hypothetical protein [Microscillaceae bacterium]
MKQYLGLWVVCLVLTSQPLAWSQNPAYITLDQAIAIVLTDNPQVKTAELDKQIALSQIREAKSAFLPQVNAKLNYQYNFRVPTQLIPAATFGGPAGEFRAAQLGVAQSVTIGLQAEQVIYNPILNVGLQMADLGIEITDKQVRLNQETAVYNVCNAYYNLQALYKRAEYLQMNVSSLDKLAATAQRLQKQGFSKQIDVDRLLLSKQNVEVQLQNLVLMQVQLENTLKLLLNMPFEQPLQIDTALHLPDKYSLTDDFTRTEMEMVDMQLKFMELEKKNIRAGFLPRVNATAALNYWGFNSVFQPFTAINNQLYPASFAGLTVVMPVFDGFMKRNQLNTKDLQMQKVMTQRTTLKQSISMEMINSQNKYNQNLLIFQNLQQNLTLAKRNFDMLQNQYKEGLIGINDIITAEIALQEAQGNYLNGLVQIRLAELDVKKASGNLIK